MMGQWGNFCLTPLLNIHSYEYNTFNTYILPLCCISIVEMVPTRNRSCSTYWPLQSVSMVQQVEWCKLRRKSIQILIWNISYEKNNNYHSMVYSHYNPIYMGLWYVDQTKYNCQYSWYYCSSSILSAVRQNRMFHINKFN